MREIVAMDGRQYLQQHHHHRLHRANSSLAQTTHSTSADQPEGDSDKSTSPSVLYYSSPAPHAEPLTTSSPHDTVNDSLIEAMFQIDSVNSIQFIDSNGCPTDANLMGPLVRMDPHGHRLLAPFDAFKFPTSDMVFFRAVVTSCLAECKPAVCPNYSPAAATPTAAAPTTPSVLYSNTLAQAEPNSIGGEETTPLFEGKPKPGIAQLLTLSGDN